MTNPNSNARFLAISGIVFLAAISRLLPHPPNFTPVGALALFGAAHFRRHIAVLIPFIALWFSDLLLNNLVYAAQFPELYDGFSWFGSPAVYLSFGLVSLLGMRLLRKISWQSVLGASVAGSLLFFLITNFAAWVNNPFYPQNVAGLMQSYIAGIPFFWNSLAGDVFFAGVLFGSFAALQRIVPQLVR